MRRKCEKAGRKPSARCCCGEWKINVPLLQSWPSSMVAKPTGLPYCSPFLHRRRNTLHEARQHLESEVLIRLMWLIGASHTRKAV